MTVLRWHSHPNPALRNSGDTVEAHQLRVVTMCIDLAAYIAHPLHDSDLLKAARHHDAAEAVLGDMPGPAKDRFPALAAAYAKAELHVLTEMGLTCSLTRKEGDMLNLCDKLDALEWAAAHGVSGGEWGAALGKLRSRAAKIGATEWLGARLHMR